MSDLISRQAVKEQSCMFFGHEVIFANKIDLIPPANKPQGKWVEKLCNYEYTSIPWYVCDQCGEERRKKEKFCPNCGAKMEA